MIKASSLGNQDRSYTRNEAILGGGTQWRLFSIHGYQAESKNDKAYTYMVLAYMVLAYEEKLFNMVTSAAYKRNTFKGWAKLNKWSTRHRAVPTVWNDLPEDFTSSRLESKTSSA
jgi:hypothetical protein